MPVYVSDLLAITPAPVNAAPTATRTFQWLRGSTAISGATSSTYTAVTADIGSPIAASQIETNFLGTTTATSAPTEVVQAFDPIRLFSASEPGVWYDPNDISTLYKGTASITPVTAPGDAVSLMLDKSRGTIFGPELVTNGNFSSGADGWSLGANWAVVDTALKHTAGIASFSQQTRATLPLGANKWFIATITVSGMTAGNFAWYLGGANTGAVNSNGVWTRYFMDSGVSYSMLFDATSTFDGSIDSVSVKELLGMPATQPTEASRPIYGIVPAGGRRNLLLQTEGFENAVWIKYQSAVTANAVAAPDGTTTAEKLVPAASVSPGFIYYNGSLAILSIGTVTTASVYVKAAELGFALIANNNNASSVASAACINLSTGALTNQGGSGTYSVVSAGNGWWRVSVTSTSTTAQNSLEVSPLAVAGSYNSYTGNGTSGIYIWGAQIELSATATPYQRVTTQYDVTEAGVASLGYLFFDGSGDFMSTGTITPGTDKAQVFAGVRKLSDASVQQLVEFSPSVSGGNSGSFSMPASDGGATWVSALRGNGSVIAATASGLAAPITTVNSALMDLADPTAETKLRINGTQAAASTGDSGSGNFLAYPLYIGYRNATANLYFNGHIHSLIVRFGPNLTTARISATESWVASKTAGVTL